MGICKAAVSMLQQEVSRVFLITMMENAIVVLVLTMLTQKEDACFHLIVLSFNTIILECAKK